MQCSIESRCCTNEPQVQSSELALGEAVETLTMMELLDDEDTVCKVNPLAEIVRPELSYAGVLR